MISLGMKITINNYENDKYQHKSYHEPSFICHYHTFCLISPSVSDYRKTTWLSRDQRGTNDAISFRIANISIFCFTVCDGGALLPAQLNW